MIPSEGRLATYFSSMSDKIFGMNYMEFAKKIIKDNISVNKIFFKQVSDLYNKANEISPFNSFNQEGDFIYFDLRCE